MDATRKERVSGAFAKATPASMPAIDHKHLSKYTFGNRDLEIEVLGLFAGQAPETLQQMAVAATDKAWRDAAHTLKGSARAVGAFAVGALAEKAECLTKSDGEDAKCQAIDAITEALELAYRHIEMFKAAA